METKGQNSIGGSKLAAHFAHFQKWTDGQVPGPLVVEVAATHGCNHDCLHCGFQQFNRFSTEKSFLDSDAFKRFIDDFATMGGKEIYFAGNGEPLLNPLIDEWIAYIRGNGVDCTLSTNGILLSPERQSQILPHLKWIRFSVNGGDAQTYAKVHRCPEPDFDTLTANIARAVEYRDAHGLQVRLVIQSLVYEANWRSLQSLVREHEKMQADLLILRNVAFREKSDPVPSPEIVRALQEAEKAPRVQVRWETFGVNVPEMKWSRCFGINFRTNMDDKGNLFACFCPDCFFGNIHDLSFKEIWESERKRDLFRTIESGRFIPQCKRWCPTGYDNVFIENHREGND